MPLFTGSKFGWGQPNAAGGPAGSPYMVATGGNTVTSPFPMPDGNVYKAHVFTSSGAFVVESIGTLPYGATVDYLVVAGGGGGGCRGGGGGAGGLRSTVTDTGGGGSLESSVTVNAAPHPVTVGAGGAGQPLNVPGTVGNQGENSSFGYTSPTGSSTVSSTGGGGGCSDGTPSGAPGGSGGGGANNKPGAGGTSNQGYAGGNASGDSNAGGGGAGAAGAGGSDTPTAGPGGAGVIVNIAGPTSPWGRPGPSPGRWFAGGGGGGHGGNGTAGSGGAGGGGSASPWGPGTYEGVGGGGNANTGGGGAGGSGYPNKTGGDGGPGIVIIRYRVS